MEAVKEYVRLVNPIKTHKFISSYINMEKMLSLTLIYFMFAGKLVVWDVFHFIVYGLKRWAEENNKQFSETMTGLNRVRGS